MPRPETFTRNRVEALLRQARSIRQFKEDVASANVDQDCAAGWPAIVVAGLEERVGHTGALGLIWRARQHVAADLDHTCSWLRGHDGSTGRSGFAGMLRSSP